MAFMVRIREHSLWNAAIMRILVEEELISIYVRGWHDQQIEVVKHLLLLGSPIIIVEVIVNPHKALIQNLWDQ